MVIKQAFLVLSMTVALALSGCSRQQSDWEKTRAANTTDAYELFLKKYPSGEFTAQAQARVKELYEERDWQKARDTDTLDAYQAFLKQYPEGKWSEEARIRVENFTLAAAPSHSRAAVRRNARRRRLRRPRRQSPRRQSPRRQSPRRQNPRRGARRRPRRSRRDPMACNSARSNPVPMPPTNVGRASTSNILNCCRDCRPKSLPRKAHPARCIVCRSRD